MAVSNQGSLNDRYQVVPRTLIFLTCKEKLLLLKASPEKRLWANLYNGLGGHIECGEDVMSAARRELEEETGLAGISLWLCGVITIDSGQDAGVIIFVVRGETDQPDPAASNEGVPEWVSIENLNDLPLVEDLPVLLPLVLASHPGDPPFSTHYRALPSQELKISFYTEEK